MLRVQITKRNDGGGVLRCTRADGSYTWQKQNERHAAFFSLHDLTHFAVESTLRLREGFFGLIAQGWDVDDTMGKGPRGKLPRDAGVAESIVGLLDMERAGGVMYSPEEFNQHSPRALTADELAGMRKLRSELFAKWSAVEPGQTLDLVFPA